MLAKDGLKGVWNANEPAVLPEAFFVAHPELRGPRIDQTNRSRKTYYAPSVDQPETLRMYREAMQSLLKICPEVERVTGSPPTPAPASIGRRHSIPGSTATPTFAIAPCRNASRAF